jgi:hypothetical protein
MPTPPLPESVMRDTLELVAQHGTVTHAAAASGVPYGTFNYRHRMARLWSQTQAAAALPAARDFESPDLPDETPTAAELLKRRELQFARKKDAKDARALIPVTVKIDGPIGVMHVGDPHVDDDGTDLRKLQDHVALANRTEGLFAGCVGDYSNNWIGRLARLYAEQSTSAREAWVLVEWLIRACDWLYLVGGNHDAWSGAGDPLEWIARQTGHRYDRNGARLELRLPSKRAFRINARHEFAGTSQWNAAHGPAKAVQMGARDHVVTCGHQHTSGYQVLKDPATGLISHALRVASYKTFDRYADEKNLRDQHIFVAPVTILDPDYADTDVRAVTTIFDPGEAAEYLTWKRKRWAKGRSR